MGIQNTNNNHLFYTLEKWAFQIETFFQSFGLVILALLIYQPTLLFHLFIVGLLPLFNLLLLIYWLPLLLCLLGAEYEDSPLPGKLMPLRPDHFHHQGA